MEHILYSIQFADALDIGFLNLFVQLTAYIVPYFLIPAALKTGMGAFSALTGMLNDRSRGFFDRQRKFREGQRQKYNERARGGNRFAGGTKTNFRGRLNRGISGGLTAPGAILDSGNTFKPNNWRAATRVGMQNAHALEIERNMKENQAYQSWMHDDGLNKAASKTRNAAELRSYLSEMRNDDGSRAYEGQALDDAVNRVENVRRSMSTPAFQAMTVRQAGAGGTAYKTAKDATKKTAAGEFWLDVARASKDDDAMASYLVANGRSETVKAGRMDTGGAGFGTTLGVVNKFREKLRNGEEVTLADIEEATKTIHKDVYEGQGGASLVHSSMKPDSIKELAPEMVSSVQDAQASGSDKQFTQSLASLAAVYDGMQGSSPAKAKIVADEVLSKTIDIATLSPEMKARLQPALLQSDGSYQFSGTITYQQAIDGLRGNSDFKEMRREYANEIAQRAGQAPPEPGSEPNPSPLG